MKVLGRLLGLGLLMGLFVQAVGCGGSKGTISGKVTYKGQPLPGGQVTFVSKQGGGGQATINAQDGSYKMEKVPVGPGSFAVQAPNNSPPPMMPGSAAPPKSGELPKGFDPSKFNKKGGPSVKLPDKYKDPNQSGLQYDVKGGDQVHNIELE